MTQVRRLSESSGSCAGTAPADRGGATPGRRCSFFFNVPATTEINTLSLHDALPISACRRRRRHAGCDRGGRWLDISHRACRSEEHTSELQSRRDLVCRLLLEKKKREVIRVHITVWAAVLPGE